MLDIDFKKLALAPTSLIDILCSKAPNNPRFFIYGAGTLGRKLQKELKAKGETVAGFIDNNPLLHGQQIDGLTCIPFSDLNPLPNDICIISIWHYQHDPACSLAHARALGFLHILHFSAVVVWKNLGDIFPNYAVDHPANLFTCDSPDRIKKLLNLLSDDESRVTALKILNFHAYPNMEELPTVSFRNLPFDPTKIATYVDGGAFVGDDFKRHLREFTSLQCARLIEPDPNSFNLLQLLNFPFILDYLAINAALNHELGTIRFKATGNWGSMVADGPISDCDINVDCLTLDSIGKTLPLPIYIKMDLEGHELNALKGAHELLSSNDVIFSITLEHRAADIFEIPEFLAKYDQRSSFLFAHDSEFCMDLVLYSVPVKHLKKHEFI